MGSIEAWERSALKFTPCNILKCNCLSFCSMVAGTPAKVVGVLNEPTPSLTMKHGKLSCRTLFISTTFSVPYLLLRGICIQINWTIIIKD